MHIQLDPVGGMAGDMFVAAMLDAFPALEPAVQKAVRAAGLPARFRCDLEPHQDHALTGKRFLVREPRSAEGASRRAQPGVGHRHSDDHVHEHKHEHEHEHEHGHQPFSMIRSGLQSAPLEAEVLQHAIAIFTALAEAEASVHGASVDTVTFHELGEWDSIADIVAAAAIIGALPGATWSVGPLPLGSGFVTSAHGLLPVPAPAAAILLRGLAVRDDGIGGERVTPTGAAIARYLVSRPGERPRVLKMMGSGLGFGTRAMSEISNCLRALVFEQAEENAASEERVTSIEFEVDDQTPEDLALGLDRLRAHPLVLDVLQAPVFAKKGRVAMGMRVLCPTHGETEVARLCFLETTTLGLRLVDARRRTLSRSEDTVLALGRSLHRKSVERGSEVTSKVEAESLRDVSGHQARERLRRAAEDR